MVYINETICVVNCNIKNILEANTSNATCELKKLMLLTCYYQIRIRFIKFIIDYRYFNCYDYKRLSHL